MVTLLWGLMFAAALVAEQPHGPSPEQAKAAREHNRAVSLAPSMRPPRSPLRPFSDIEPTGYLFFSAEGQYDSASAKKIMAKELPRDVTLVIFAEPGSDAKAIRDTYQGLIDPGRLKVVAIPNASSGFWARDGLPVPVWGSGQKLDLVDARYYHGFEPDSLVARWFSSFLFAHSYYYEGGNFMPNDRGECLMVDNERAANIPIDVFKDYYGCRRTVRLPHEKGIGHVDESVRFVRTDTVVTDLPEYARALRAEGYRSVLLPRPKREYETYVNSLIVNGTVFIPVFGQSTDAEAVRVYESAGLRAVPIKTVSLANNGHGSLHCITMTYPPVPFAELLRSLGAREL